MKSLSTRITYYISNYGDGTISVVDGEENEIVKNITCGFQSYDTIADSENKIFVANSGSNTISIICNNNSIRTLKMPNNGHIAVNSNISKIYVSNVNSIEACDVEKGNLFWKVDNLYSVRFIKLSNSKNKLFVLDDNMIKIYNAYNGNFIGSVAVGNSPSFIESNKNDSIVYVSNTMDNSISVIDMNSLTIIDTIFGVGNAPIGMKLLQNNLYIANSLGNNITIINTLTNAVISSIPVGIGPERIVSTPNGEKLLISNTTDNTISVINFSTNTVELNIHGFNQPIGITAVNANLSLTPSQSIDLTDKYQLKDINEAVCITVKKIFSNCVSRMCFSNVMEKVQIGSIYPYTIGLVRFSKGFVVPETEKRIPLENNPYFSRIGFSLVIPYNIEYYDRKGDVFKLEGTIKDEEKNIVLYVPVTRSEIELKTIINTRSQLLDTPTFKDGAFTFSVGTFLQISIVGEVDLLIPAFPYCTDPPGCEEYVDDSDLLCKEIFKIKLFPSDFYPRDDFFY